VNLDSSARSERRRSFARRRQLETPEQPKALTVKEADRLQVSGNGSDVDVLGSETSGRGDRLPREERPNAETPMPGIHDDRLELRLVRAEQQSAQSKNLTRNLSNPDSTKLWVPEVRIELNAGVWATECWIVVDVAMALRQTAPELATALEVSGFIFP